MSWQKAIQAVDQEIARAKSLHPGNFHGRHEGYAVLLEEVDELWELAKKNPVKMDRYDAVIWRNKMYKEAIQIAAMAVRFASEVC